MKIFQVNAKRRVPFEDLSLEEVTVLPKNFVPAESEEEALEEFYFRAPIEDHSRFDISVEAAR